MHGMRVWVGCGGEEARGERRSVARNEVGDVTKIAGPGSATLSHPSPQPYAAGWKEMGVGNGKGGWRVDSAWCGMGEGGRGQVERGQR